MPANQRNNERELAVIDAGSNLIREQLLEFLILLGTIGQPEPPPALLEQVVTAHALAANTSSIFLGKMVHRLGYRSEAAFSRAFKRHTGVSPGCSPPERHGLTLFFTRKS